MANDRGSGSAYVFIEGYYEQAIIQYFLLKVSYKSVKKLCKIHNKLHTNQYNIKSHTFINREQHCKRVSSNK